VPDDIGSIFWPPPAPRVLASLLAFADAVNGVPASARHDPRETVRQLRLPVITIAFILDRHRDELLRHDLVDSPRAGRTGVLLFSAWLGAIGVFLTGSDTSSNTLFGAAGATAKLSGLDRC
jgi:L-lactate permease